jgi:hypothetical protein
MTQSRTLAGASLAAILLLHCLAQAGTGDILIGLDESNYPGNRGFLTLRIGR